MSWEPDERGAGIIREIDEKVDRQTDWYGSQDVCLYHL